jgi:two-component system, OmpR family, sensor histidine kinase VicK
LTGIGNRRFRYACRLALVAGAYLGMAKVGLSLAFENSSVTAVWPPTGIALAALIVWGFRIWPGVALGALLANAWTGVPLVTVLGITTGNTLEALVGSYLLMRVAHFRPSLERVRDVLALVTLAALLSTVISATVGVSSLRLGDALPAEALTSTWRVWWLGDLGGDLLVAPFLLVLAARPRLNFEWRRIAEALGLVVVAIATSVVVFSQEASLTFLVLPPIAWAALRFRQQGAAVASLIVAAVSVWFTAHGMGPFAQESPDTSLLLSQTFMGIAAVTGLVLAAITREREGAEEALQRAHDELDERVRERTAQLEESIQELALQSTIGANIAEGIVLVRASDLTIVYASPTFERMFGYGAGELDGLQVSVLNASAATCPEEAAAEIIVAVREQGSWRGEVHNVKKDGTPFWCWANVSTFEHPQYGTVWLTVQGDITAHKHAENQLKKREAQLAEAQRIAQIGSWEWDIKNDEVSWSDELYRIHGVDTGGFNPSYEAFLDGVHPDDRALVERTINKAFADCQPFEYEYRCLLPEGGHRILHAQGRVEADERDRPSKMLGTCQDVTELKRAERPVRRLAAIVESSEDAIFSKTLDGTIDTWNPGAERLYGYAAEEIIGRPVSVLVPPERAGEEDIVMNNAIAGEGALSIETARLAKDGSRREVSLTVSPIKDQKGRLMGFSSISRDISERKRLQVQADRLKDEFFATVSHELRTPLTSIIGYTDLLLRGEEGEMTKEQRHFLEITERNAMRQLRLVNDLLFVSRAEAGEFAIETRWVELASVVNECLESARPDAGRKDVELVESVETAPASLGDPDRLAQLVDNLVSNAIKFTPRDGKVEVRLALEGDRASLEVANSGSYISPQEQNRLFDRFYRTASASNDAVQGVGLGLTISKAIVEAHDGWIEVESDEDSGTVFRVSLPLREPPKVIALRHRRKETAAA